MEYPLVTVFTLIYNTNPDYIIAAIESVRRNNYPNLQHIIIDDASPNPEPKETVKVWIAKNHHPCEFHEHTENFGICKTLNHVLELSRGKYLFGCCDDLLTPDRIRNDVSWFERLGQEYAIVFGLAQLVNAQGEPLPRVLPSIDPVPDDHYWDRMLQSNFLMAPSVTFRMDVIKALKFNEQLKFEDYEIYLRLLSSGYKFKCQPVINSYYRVHGHNISHSFDYALENLKVLSLFGTHESVMKVMFEKTWNMAFNKSRGYEEAVAIYEQTFGKNRNLRLTAAVKNTLLLKLLVRLLKLNRQQAL